MTRAERQSELHRMLDGDLQTFAKVIALYGEAAGEEATIAKVSRVGIVQTILNAEAREFDLARDPMPETNEPAPPPSSGTYRIVRIDAFGSHVVLGTHLNEAAAQSLQSSINSAGEVNVLMELEKPGESRMSVPMRSPVPVADWDRSEEMN